MPEEYVAWIDDWDIPRSNSEPRMTSDMTWDTTVWQLGEPSDERLDWSAFFEHAQRIVFDGFERYTSKHRREEQEADYEVDEDEWMEFMDSFSD